jgi:exodeoxyribonuclease VII large subunit
VSTPLTVTAICQILKSHLGEFFGHVVVTGELSGFTAHRSGHWYFTIKDQNAVLNCAMFRGDNNRCRFQPRSGDKVVLTGGIDVYGPQGKMNFIVRTMTEDGAGDLQKRLEELKAKLAAEGLFDPGLKKQLPVLPGTIGVVTSPTGAALHDILKVLNRRFPGRHVLLSPCRVQGEGAAAEVAHAIRRLEADGRAEVIIAGRGGGSPEDLMAFNDEELARTIAACSIPVVSAVGHEVDVSISDLVADVRAATPSHAAELVVPERDSIQGFVNELEERLHVSMMHALTLRRDRLSSVVLRDPRRRVEEGRLRLDDLSDRLSLVAKGRMQIERAKLGQAGGRLDALSPLRVLERGYSVVTHQEKLIVSADSLAPGDDFSVRFSDGSVAARVVQDSLE